MGFSVSGSAALIFLGGIVAFGMFYTATANGFEQVSEAQQDRTDRVLRQQNTQINVTAATYDSSANDLTVTVTNNGTSELSVRHVDLLVDGDYRSSYDTSVDGDGSTDLWLPQEELTITVTSLSTAPDRVKVITGPGVSDTSLVEVI